MSYQHYFEDVVTNLSIEDLFLLTYLKEREANEKFKSVSRKTLIKEVFEQQPAMTEATIRKSFHRLEALKFISLFNSGKQQKIYISTIGLQALELN